MLQVIDGTQVFVVDFDTVPELPIRWANDTEKPYAMALGAAIATGVITEPGKYGIEVGNYLPDVDLTYTIHTIIE
jgi:hypothetical protein